MSSPYDDPNYRPPADIRGPEARIYEEKVLQLLREALLPDSGPVIVLQAIELRGERPDTEVLFIYTNTREPGRRSAQRAWLWKDPVYSPLEEEDSPRGTDKLQEPFLIAAAVGSAWQAGELEPIELPVDDKF